MKRIFLARKAARSLAQNKTRAVLTSLAIAVSAFVMTLSLAAGEGTRQYSNRLVETNINPNAIFIAKDKALVDLGTDNNSTSMLEYDPEATKTNRGEIVKQLDEADLKEIQSLDEIGHVQPRPAIEVEHISLVGSNKKFVAPVTAYDPTIRYNVVAGNVPGSGEPLEKDSMIMPNRFADVMVGAGVIEKPSDLVGKQITITVKKPTNFLSHDYYHQIFEDGGIDAVTDRLAHTETKQVVLTVSAISKRLSSMTTSLSGNIQIPLETMLDMHDFINEGTVRYNKYTLVSAILKEGYTAEEVKKIVEAKGYHAVSSKDLQALLIGIVTVLQGIALGFGVLTLIASVFGIINTQYISVLERTRQIGLMKALGMSSSDVAKLFRYEAAWIGLIGSLIGVIAARIVIFIANPIIKDRLALAPGEQLLILPFLAAVPVIVGGMIVAIVAGYLPARKAAKLDPIKALRVE